MGGKLQPITDNLYNISSGHLPSATVKPTRKYSSEEGRGIYEGMSVAGDFWAGR